MALRGCWGVGTGLGREQIDHMHDRHGGSFIGVRFRPPFAARPEVPLLGGERFPVDGHLLGPLGDFTDHRVGHLALTEHRPRLKDRVPDAQFREAWNIGVHLLEDLALDAFVPREYAAACAQGEHGGPHQP
jgi:hypothetical protein